MSLSQILAGTAIVISALACLSLSSCQQRDSSASSSSLKEIVVYSFRSDSADLQLFRQFETRNNVRVKVETMTDQAMLQRLAQEAGKPVADMVMFSDIAWAEMAQKQGTLQICWSDAINRNVPSRYTDKDGYWVGLSKWALAFVHAKSVVGRDRYTSYDALADARLKGKVLIPGYKRDRGQALVAAMLANEKEAVVQQRMKGWVDNKLSLDFSNDNDLFTALSAGKAAIALTNGESFLRWRYSGNPQSFQASEQLDLVYPTDNAGRSYFNMVVAAMPANSPNKDYGLLLVGFLTSTDAQGVFCDSRFELPVNAAVIPSELLLSNSVFVEIECDWGVATEKLDAADQLLQSAGW